MKGGGFSRAIDHVGTAALGCPAEQSSADFVSLPGVARLGWREVFQADLTFGLTVLDLTVRKEILYDPIN